MDKCLPLCYTCRIVPVRRERKCVMNKTGWIALALAAPAAALRLWQLGSGFDSAGLPVRGNLPGILLTVLLAGAAAYFIYTARRLPAQRDAVGGLSDRFSFRGGAAVGCAVAGTFLILLGAAAAVLFSTRGLSTLLLAMFAAAAAFCLLYVTSALRRAQEPQGTALLVPVCCLVVYLIFVYRADAVDPVLARVWVELLALSALTLSTLELAAFAFRGGAPRVFVPACALALILSVTAAAECRSLASAALFLGSALLSFTFLQVFEEKQPHN